MGRLSRRGFVRLAGAASAAGALWTGGLGRAFARAELPWTAIGFSQAGFPLVVHRLGDGPQRVFLLGGQHGGPEVNTTTLVRELMEHFVARPWEVPPGVGLDFMPEGNPDGLAAGIRQYLSGVDPNRNWGGPSWQPDAYDSNGHFRPGLGGSEPFSEQETRALADWLLQTRPVLTINYHSAGGFMFGPREDWAGEVAEAYAEASGYYRPAPGGGSPLPYRATGSTNAWLREMGMAGLFIELTTPWGTEFERNLAGVRAVLGRVGEDSGVGEWGRGGGGEGS